MISLESIDLLKSVPQNLKDLNVYTFSKNIKNFSQSNSQKNLSHEIKYYLLLVHRTSIISYFTTIIIFNDVFFFVSALFLFPRLYQM